jgi:dTDP-4-amino-4,6-dideoxygalactose transaminase
MAMYDLAYFGGNPVLSQADITNWPAPVESHISALKDVVKSGKYHRVNHPIVELFESEFCQWTELPFIRTVGSGTAALHICLDYYKQAGQKVIVSALNWPGAIGPIFHAGMTPLFVDVNIEDACMDDQKVIESLNKSQNNIAIILATHLFGNTNLLSQTRNFLKTQSRISIIDDCAQHIGLFELTKNRDNFKFDALTVSGNGSKHLGAGELGVICSSIDGVINHVDKVSLVSSSRNGERIFSPCTMGFNYRPNVFSAAIALDRLETIQQQVNDRRNNVFDLIKELRTLQGLELLFNTRETSNSFCSLPLRIDFEKLNLPKKGFIRDNILKLLKAEGLPVSVWLTKPVWEYLPYKLDAIDLKDFPNTHKLLESMFYLTEIAPPNNSRTMYLYAAAFQKVWNAIPLIADSLSREPFK